MKNYYQILFIQKNATLQEIKKAYRILALEFHPDKNKSIHATEKFIEITEAYEILKDPIKRQEYDKKLNLNKSNIIIENETSFNEEWVRSAQESAKKDAKMNYNDFKEKIAIHATNVSKLGCILFFIICCFCTIIASFSIPQDRNGNSTAIWGVLGVIILFIAIGYFISTFKSYKDELKK